MIGSRPGECEKVLLSQIKRWREVIQSTRITVQ